MQRAKPSGDGPPIFAYAQPIGKATRTEAASPAIGPHCK